MSHTARSLLATPQRRAYLALALLLGACAGNLYLARDVARLWKPEPLLWEPEPYIERLAAVGTALPPDARLGYVNRAHATAPSERDLFAVRFALTPRCVVAGPDAPYLLVQDVPGTDIDSGGRAVLVDEPSRGLKLLGEVGPR